MGTRGGSVSSEARSWRGSSRSEARVGGQQEASSWVGWRVGRILPEDNIPVCYGEMMMFEGGDRLEKSEGMELTRCEEYDMMLEYTR